MIVFLFVEGYYDKLFFENVLKKIDFCVDINVQEYAQKQPSRINDYLKSIVKSGNVYILIADLDPEQYQSSIAFPNYTCNYLYSETIYKHGVSTNKASCCAESRGKSTSREDYQIRKI